MKNENQTMIQDIMMYFNLEEEITLQDFQHIGEDTLATVITKAGPRSRFIKCLRDVCHICFFVSILD